LIHEEQLGLLECFVLEVIEKRFRCNVTYREANTSNQSIKCRGGEGEVRDGEGGLQWLSNSAHYGGIRHNLKRGK
jgi:hypothetical protein